MDTFSVNDDYEISVSTISSSATPVVKKPYELDDTSSSETASIPNKKGHGTKAECSTSPADDKLPGMDEVSQYGPKKNLCIRPFDPFINYELLVWILFLTITTLAIIDRFVWNVWPRQLYRIGAGSAGNDRMTGLKDGPWSVKVYDSFARISGRYSIFSLNLLFYTMMRATSAWLAETWIARRVVDFSNHEDANRRIHIYNGIGLIVLTLSHVWTIIFPCIVSGWSAKVVAGVFEWPLSERTPPGFKDADVATRTMSLQVDDVFRIILMTIMLAIILPLTVRWFQTKWHIGIQIHSLIAIIYFIDIVRRHSHPHSWILNTPFFVAWILDHFVGTYWRRQKPSIFRKRLSDDYMVLFWEQNVTSMTVAPKYYLKHRESASVERSHVFTGTENRLGADIAEGREWTTCLVVRVYHSTRRVRLPRQDKTSHTARLAEVPDLDVFSWGPFHGAISERVRSALEDERQDVVLAGGGSAAGYVLDGLQHHLVKRCGHLKVLYTARDCGVFLWMVETICEMRKCADFENVIVVIAVTDGGCGDESGELENATITARQQVADGFDATSADSSVKTGKGKGVVEVQNGRVDFVKEIRAGNLVFFEGSGGLQKAIRKACSSVDAKLVSGPAFDEEKRSRPKSLRMNCFSPRAVRV